MLFFDTDGKLTSDFYQRVHALAGMHEDFFHLLIDKLSKETQVFLPSLTIEYMKDDDRYLVTMPDKQMIIDSDYDLAKTIAHLDRSQQVFYSNLGSVSIIMIDGVYHLVESGKANPLTEEKDIAAADTLYNRQPKETSVSDEEVQHLIHLTHALYSQDPNALVQIKLLAQDFFVSKEAYHKHEAVFRRSFFDKKNLDLVAARECLPLLYAQIIAYQKSYGFNLYYQNKVIGADYTHPDLKKLLNQKED